MPLFRPSASPSPSCFRLKFVGVVFEQVVAHFCEVFCAVKQRGIVPKPTVHLALHT